MENSELYHYGVKGMHWGIRRSPTQLGHKPSTATKKPAQPADKNSLFKRKSKTKDKVDSTKKKQEVKEVETEEEAKAKIAAKKAEVLNSRSAKAIYDNANLFTYEELNAAYNRLNLERNIKNLEPPHINKGKKFLDEAHDWGDKVSKVVGTGTKLYNQFAIIRNSTHKDVEPWPIMKDQSGDKNKGDKKDKNLIDEMFDDVSKQANKADAKRAKKEAKRDKKEADNINRVKEEAEKKASETTYYTGEVSGTGTSRRTEKRGREYVDAEWSDVPIAGLLEPPKDRR